MQLTTILHSVIQPFSSVQYYKTAVEKSLSKSIIFLLFVLTTLGIITGIHTVFTKLPQIHQEITQTATEAVEHYPDDLVFFWDGSQLTFEQSGETIDRFRVPFSEKIKSQLAGAPENFALFINQKIESPQDIGINPSDATIVIGHTTVFFAESPTGDSWSSYKLTELLTDVPSTSVTKQMFSGTVEGILNAISNNFTQIQLASFFLVTLLFVLSKFWFFVIEGILVLLVFKLYDITLSASETLVLVMHVLATTSIFVLISELIYGNIQFPLQTVSFWIVIFYLMFQFRKKTKVVA